MKDNIDELFKKGLEDPQIPFNEEHWAAMERRLDQKKKKRVFPLWPILAGTGIAAAILIALVWLLPNQRNEVPRVVVHNKGKVILPDTQITSVQTPRIEKSPSQNVSLKRPISLALGTSKIEQHHLQELVAVKLEADTNRLLLGLADMSLAEIKRPAPEKDKPEVLRKSRIALSILAAPDFSSIPSSGSSGSPGANIGALATLRLNSKFSVTTGINYSKKYYNSNFSSYRPDVAFVPSTKISIVKADCDVLDIPLNVNYKVYERRGNVITINSGLSSYFMLKERYSFIYDASATNPQWRADMVIKNENQHILGIANLGIIFQHKINERFSISAQPFLKLPLTNIGYGNTRLKTSGVAVSLNMNLMKGFTTIHP